MAMLDWPQCDSETSTCAISRAHAFVCGTDKERKRFYRRYYNLCKFFMSCSLGVLLGFYTDALTTLAGLEHCRHRA